MQKDNVSDISLGMSMLSNQGRSKVDTPLENNRFINQQVPTNDHSMMSLGLSEINKSQMSEGISTNVKNLNHQSQTN